MVKMLISLPGLIVLFGTLPLVHAGTTPEASCKSTKARAAGKQASEMLKAFGQNQKLPNPLRLDFDLARSQSRFAKSFSKADGKGGCLTVGDSSAIQAKVEAFVADVVGICDCCPDAGLLSFQAMLSSGPVGTLRNFRCSGLLQNHACTTDTEGTDCDFGSCILPAGICEGDFSIACGSDTDCTGTCMEISALNLPLTLLPGRMYPGGGGSGLVLPPVWPFRFSDTTTLVTKVTSCDQDAMTLGPTTALEAGSGVACTSAGCLFGAPMPVAGHCTVFRLADDVEGTGTCRGETELRVQLDMDIYGQKDSLSVLRPPEIPGLQPCPLCVQQCSGGSTDRFPCRDDNDCVGGVCSSATECLGGPSDGAPCTPHSTDFGLSYPGSYLLGYPTSYDCLPSADDFSETVASVNMTLASRNITTDAKDLGSGTGAARVFCGFCRDNFGQGGICFEGDTRPGCPPAVPVASGTPVPCDTDADCADGDEYESCAQRTSGAFGEGAATQITLNGSPAMCLAGGDAEATTLASVFCIPPNFESVTIDDAFDLPGPGALTLTGTVQLSAP